MGDTGELTIPPPGLGIELARDATISGDGWLVREVWLPTALDGPPGILQGGFAAGLAGSVARVADRFGAPLTSIEARLRAPTPLGRTLQARVRATDVVARYRVELRDADTLLVEAEAELAGHDPAARVGDLAELATLPLPAARPQYAFPSCWVCGPEPRHPLAQRLHPRPASPTTGIVPWVADEELGDDHGAIEPLVVSAVLDCPSSWAGMDAATKRGYAGLVLANYQLLMFRDAPVMEPLRTVARMDSIDGRKVLARAALVDDDRVVYAVASALHIAVEEVPTRP